MAGMLTIHSSGSGEMLSGHSWIEYVPERGVAKTYGTWGNDPIGKGNGLFENIELGRSSDASRTMHIDDKHEAELLSLIDQYKKEGNSGWGYLSPCSTFAADAWKAGTGETLSHRSGIISNPSKLKTSIEAAAAKDAKKAAERTEKPKPARPSSSRKRCKSSTQACGPEKAPHK